MGGTECGQARRQSRFSQPPTLVQLRFSHGRERIGCLGAQRYRGRECARCNEGYYPWFEDCTQCPDPFGWTAKNALTVVYLYGTIWLLWLIINRVL